MGSVRRVRPAREWLARSTGPPYASVSTIGPPHRPSGDARTTQTPRRARATTSGSRAKNERSRGLGGSSGSTTDAAADLAFQCLRDRRDRIVEGGVDERLVGGLEAQSVCEAQLARVEWRTLVAVEKSGADQKRAGV